MFKVSRNDFDSVLRNINTKKLKEASKDIQVFAGSLKKMFPPYLLDWGDIELAAVNTQEASDLTSSLERYRSNLEEAAKFNLSKQYKLSQAISGY